MIVVKYINKTTAIEIGKVDSVVEFYQKYMRPNRVNNIQEFAQQQDKLGYTHAITKHSSITNEYLELITNQ